jgi:hypothetical protein
MLSRRTPPKLTLTKKGMEKAEEILADVSDFLEPDDSWAFGASNDFKEWLLVHGYRGFSLGQPYSQDGMLNFRQVANRYGRKISDKQLDSVLAELENEDMIMLDAGPTEDGYWGHFNRGGQVAAELLERLWSERSTIPASDRFVRLDDNAPSYSEAISQLEKLITNAKEIRVNDWPEKEGILASLSGTLESIRAKYVNKTAVMAAIGSVVSFIAIKFAEAPIAELANKTWDAIKALF